MSSAFLQVPTVPSGHKLLAGHGAGGLPLHMIPPQTERKLRAHGWGWAPLWAQSPSCAAAQGQHRLQQRSAPLHFSAVVVHQQTPPWAAFFSASSRTLDIFSGPLQSNAFMGILKKKNQLSPEKQLISCRISSFWSSNIIVWDSVPGASAFNLTSCRLSKLPGTAVLSSQDAALGGCSSTMTEMERPLSISPHPGVRHDFLVP